MSRQKKWLITGASGLLGTTFCQKLGNENIEVIGQTREHDIKVNGVCGVVMDLTSIGNPAKLIQKFNPDVVIHCAALTNVDLCEAEPELAYAINAKVCGELAEICDQIGAKFVMISTDQLWKNANQFSNENTPSEPSNVYGASKVEGERLTLLKNNTLVVRTNFFGIGPSWKPSNADHVLTTLRLGKTYTGFANVFVCPIEVGILVDTIVSCVEKNLLGIYNIAGRDRVSKFEFARQVAQCFSMSTDNITKSTAEAMNLTAQRPHEMSLSVARVENALGIRMPTLEQSLMAYKLQLEIGSSV